MFERLTRLAKAASLTLAVYSGAAFVYCVGRVYTGSVGWYAPFCDDNVWLGTFEQFMSATFVLSAFGALIYLYLRDSE